MPKQYLLRRWWRIYPPYFFALALAIFLNFATNYYKWKTGGSVTADNFGPAAILSHLFLVHDFSQKTMLAVSGPFWTIAMEMQYYLLYLAFRPFFYDLKGWAWMFTLSLALYFTAWKVYGFPMMIQPLNPFCYWIEWIAGAFLVYLVKNQLSTAWRKRWLFLSFAVFALAASRADAWGISEVGRLLFTAAFAALILFVLAAETVWVRPILRWLPAAGLFSYSIYLVHFLFMDRVRVFVIPRIPQGWPRFSASVSSIFLCLLISYGFFICFEKPYLEKAASIPKRREPM